MPKYLRKRPKQAPAHRFVGYIHGLDPNTPSTLEEYLNSWRRQESEFGRNQWDEEMEHEAIVALEWLVQNGLAEEII